MSLNCGTTRIKNKQSLTKHLMKLINSNYEITV